MISVSKLDTEDDPLKIFFERKKFYEFYDDFKNEFGFPPRKYFVIKEIGKTSVLIYPKTPSVPQEIIRFLSEWIAENEKRINLSVDGIKMCKRKKRGVWARFNESVVDLIQRFARRYDSGRKTAGKFISKLFS